MGTVKVTNIEPIADNGTLTIGNSGDTIALTSGAKTSGFGKIGQVVSNTSDTVVTSTSTTRVELINAKITPTSTSSKIFITYSVSLNIDGNSNGYGQVDLHVGNSVSNDDKILNGVTGNTANEDAAALVTGAVIHSPSTTSEQQYTLSIRKGSSGTTSAKTQNDYYITLMEILD